MPRSSRQKEMLLYLQRIMLQKTDENHALTVNEIKDLRIKEFRGSKKIYLRVNKDDFSLLKGRYWVDCLYFEKGDELFEALLKLEDKIRPHTMKAYARNQASSSQQKENKKK